MFLERSISAGGWPKSVFKNNCIFADEDNNFDYYSYFQKPSNQLFPLIQDVAYLKLVRWPIECQFSNTPVQHISNAPFMPEPAYAISGREEKPIRYEEGTVVYRNPVITLSCFHKSTTIGFLYPTCFPSDSTALRFESRFECGNLERAVQIHDTDYELYLRNDIYTSRNIQWFYFKVSNMVNKVPYRFSIVNFNCQNVLYNEGLKPLMYSVKDAQYRKVGWRRCGNDIAYYSNKFTRPENKQLRSKYSLTFTVTFTHEYDVVYFAYCYPYTYTNLQNYLLKLAKDPIKSKFTTTRVMCRTLAGNNLYCVTITSPILAKHSTQKKMFRMPNRRHKKKVVLLTARVHPSETPASWVIKGLINFLTSNSNMAKVLRDKFIFKIIPMLNPDGVIVGNTRCSLIGKDLNRQYKNPTLDAHPTIWHTKLLVQKILEKHSIVIYCDFHAHSNSHDVFLYGCEDARIANRLEEQTFAVMFKRRAADMFCLDKCKYEVVQTREGTARVAMGMMGIPLSFTLETSFGGSHSSGMHFNVQNYEDIGQSFCETIFDYFDNHPKTTTIRNKIKEILKRELIKRENENLDAAKSSPMTLEKTDYLKSNPQTTGQQEKPAETKYLLVKQKKHVKRTRPCKVPVHSEASKRMKNVMIQVEQQKS